MKRFLSVLLLCTLLLAGCSRQPVAPEPATSASIQYATEEPASLTSVLDLIYKNVEMKGLSDADSTTLSTLFHLESNWVANYAARYSNGRFGVADVAIIKPIEGHSEEILNALELRRSDRIAEFENYDVHDSLNIAKNAEIFSRGDYIILLMLSDTDAARTIILEQIPG